MVGRNVRRLRERRGLSQEDLAHLAGIHVTYLSGVENGHRNVTVGVLERLAAGLGVDETELVSR